VSVPERRPAAGEPIGVRIADCTADIIELAAFRDGSDALGSLAAARAAPLPKCGRLCRSVGGLILAVRPDRWLLCCARAATGTAARSWQTACDGRAAVIEHSAALTLFYVTGASAREMLKRGCRLDLDPRAFPPGAAAATIMAQVPVILAALASGLVLLTPASTSRHFREWLITTARPFGLGSFGSVTVAQLSGECIA
jgi:heterotetrameric sarcosine oxidase gamma subunit